MASGLTTRDRPGARPPHVRSLEGRARARSVEPGEGVPPAELVRLVAGRLRASAREAADRLTEG